ncbi:hypothetical protein B9Z19DRAFT_1193101 [Tuber borchii]|uniref:CCHC-type domain-containing protein n=1 Tax=Tuber borchii TaxID=42251 RepID=A0A2T6ZT68_TUBBO|nr:hypothetical protein B9Z19DRAFT_1193101 [Tuber borchii]
MGNSKHIEFGGDIGENVDHFLRGFTLAFAEEEVKLPEGATPESSESRAYRVITHLKSKSEAARFVSRLPAETTGDYSALTQALRNRFENSAELEEEQRYAEELFLSLRQRRGQTIDDYIRLTRRVARGMSSDNQHLVATQFVKGLDSRELRVQTMGGLSSRPSVNEAITKVQRIADIIDIDAYTGLPGLSSDEDDSGDDKEEDVYTSYWDRRRKSDERELKRKKKRKGQKAEKRITEETEQIRRNLEELKEMLTQKQRKEEMSNITSRSLSEKLPTVEAYAVGNRLAPPIGYPPQSTYSMQPSMSYKPQQFNSTSNAWSNQPQDSGITHAGTQGQGERQQWPNYEQRQFGYGQRGYDNNLRQHFGPPGFNSGIPRQPAFQNWQRDRSQLVCYQCGIVGHVRYECHLLPRRSDTYNAGRVYTGQSFGNIQQGNFQGNGQNGQAVPVLDQPSDNGFAVPPPPMPQRQTAQMTTRRFPPPIGGNRVSGEVAAVEPGKYSSAIEGMVVEVEPVPSAAEGATSISSSKYVKVLDYSNRENRVSEKSPEAMVGERARTRSQVEGSSSSSDKGPPKQRQKVTFEDMGKHQASYTQKKTLRKSRLGHHPIRLMVDKPAFDYVSSFRDVPVLGLTWGQFFDLSPESKRQFVKLMVQERSKGKVPAGKGKAKAASSRVMESAFSEAALVAGNPNDEEIVNFYTSARVSTGNKIFEINRVLLDAGSVVNLAPISVLYSLGVTLHSTKDLVIRTAASNLVPLEFYADLEIEVASVVAPMRVFAMPATCEPTYGLLLSRRWLRYCQAIGDYTCDSYVIKDKFGVDHEVPRESQKGATTLRPKVSINPSTKQIDLDGMIVDELELEEELSFEDIVRQISREAQQEIDYYKHYENRHQWDESELEDDFYSSESSERRWSSDWQSEENSTDESRSVGIFEDSLVREEGRLHEKNLIGEKNSNVVLNRVEQEEATGENLLEGSGDSEAEMGAFGEDDVYFYGEVGEWKTERLRDLRVMDMGRHELWRWDYKVLEELSVAQQSVGLVEGELDLQVGLETYDIRKAMLVAQEKKEKMEELDRERAVVYLWENNWIEWEDIGVEGKLAGQKICYMEGLWSNLQREVGFTDTDGRTLGAVCSRFYHLQGGNVLRGAECPSRLVGCEVCRIGGAVIVKKQEDSEELWDESYIAEVTTFLEMTEAACLVATKEKKTEHLKEGDDPLDAIYGGTTGYPTSRRPFEYRREID